jgi:DNA-binding transcriptional LysR family regulator
VVPKFQESGGHLMIVYPSARNVPRKVTAFRDMLVEALTVRPLAPSGG